MKKKIHSSVTMILLCSALFFGQFNPDELAERAEIEFILKSGKITKAEEIGTGVTKPYRLTLEHQGQQLRGAWKNPRGMKYGYLEGWQYEIAAYEMDKILGLNLIPPTVERIFAGKKGSLQFWVKAEMSDLQRMEKGILIPKEHELRWNKQKYLVRAFDCLIANEDRTQENILYTEDWRVILIDHSRSFRSKGKFIKKLMYGKNGIKSAKLFRILPRSFVEKVKLLTFDQIKNAVGDYLTDSEIEAILKRKQLLLDEISEMIAEKGESAVLY